MTTRAGTFLLAALLASTATQASAQDTQIGSRLEPRREIGVGRSSATSIRMYHDLATCLVHRRASSAQALLDARSEDDVRRARATLVQPVECLHLNEASDDAQETGLSASSDIERGALAEALLQRNGGGAELKPLKRVATYQSAWSAFSGRSLLVDEMAACVAATDPAGIQSLLRTMPTSAKESAALQSLVPAMGPCLVVNAKLDANPQSLRAALAEALYHRVNAPAPDEVANATPSVPDARAGAAAEHQ